MPIPGNPPKARDRNLTELVDRLPDGAVLTDQQTRSDYRQDWLHDPQAEPPLAVVRATCTRDVQEVMRWASNHRIAVVPRGAGSGLSGGATAVANGLVLSLEQMRMINIDPATHTATVQPGLLNVEVKRAAAEHRLWYPPDPASFEFCSIGGNAATNAGGLCCVKYGVTTDYVLGMEVVLADGTAVRLGGPRLKDVAGLSLTKLFVGSEGTLGIITELTLRLLPTPPTSSTVIASFDSIEDAAGAVLAISRCLRPATLELMDHTALRAVESWKPTGLGHTAEALLLAQSDAPGSYARFEVESMADACRSHGAVELFSTSDPDEGERFCAARRMAIPALERTGNRVLVEDAGVPLPVLPALFRGITDISAAVGVTIAIVAHAGDGNTHPLIVYEPADSRQCAQAEVAFDEIMKLAITLGGTITGEHGVGRRKASWLPDYLGAEAMALNVRIKQALDPLGILNPGAVF
ncbi:MULTISPECIES: FAD-binding oxidoreductase [Rhodococcus]|uniref:FAD-binding oxidoreductase n=1 Tax=Rhodococcus TaxID=1827 RepID=UPI00071827D6|nr:MULTISPECIES: FAD-linked oxidase C-terminal domain-containing protein [Rhodococcus]MEA1798291.1 FAD-linked oxidase C-terminal domain-containing protein [Rhodococcus qingshengii]